MKNLLLLLILTVSFLTFGACSKGPEPDSLDLDEDFKCMRQGASAPEWVCGNVEHEGMQIAIGKAPDSKIGERFTLNEATAEGVLKIKKSAELYVEGKIRKYARMMEPEIGHIADASAHKIAKEISLAEQNDYKQIKKWQNPVNNDLFVLVAIENKWLDGQVKDKLLALYRADAAHWKKFVEDEGEEKLNDLFESD